MRGSVGERADRAHEGRTVLVAGRRLHGHPAARAQRREAVGDRARLVREPLERRVAEDGVELAGHVELLGRAGHELDALRRRLARERDHLGREIDADHAAVGEHADLLREVPGAATEVEHVVGALDAEHPEQPLGGRLLRRRRLAVDARYRREVAQREPPVAPSRPSRPVALRIIVRMGRLGKAPAQPRQARGRRRCTPHSGAGGAPEPTSAPCTPRTPARRPSACRRSSRAAARR